MNDAARDHPNMVLDRLLGKGSRSHRLARLTALHDICRKHQESGSRDFSLSTVGRLVETEGVLKARVLYNTQSADYRELISAWAIYAGTSTSKPSKPLATHEYLMRIHDPAIRSIMQTIIVERDKLRAEVNLLKANAQVVVDRRPIGPRVQGTAIVLSSTTTSHDLQFTSSERDALEKAVSADYLERQGLREGSHGEIVNDRGRTVFDVGFARAIRKILGA